jgi:hypothetical protein
VRAVFTKTVCDGLDPLIAQGSVEAGPGLPVMRQQGSANRRGFPLPWAIEEVLKRGDEIRSILMKKSGRIIS